MNLVDRAFEELRRVMSLPTSLTERLAEMPLEHIAHTGVYFLVRDGEVVYIGQSTNISGRIAEHLGRKVFDQVLYLLVARADLDAVEGALIRRLRPPLCGMAPPDIGRDDDVLQALGLPPHPPSYTREQRRLLRAREERRTEQEIQGRLFRAARKQIESDYGKLESLLRSHAREAAMRRGGRSLEPWQEELRIRVAARQQRRGRP